MQGKIPSLQNLGFFFVSQVPGLSILENLNSNNNANMSMYFTRRPYCDFMILIFLSNFMTGSYGPSMTGTVLLGLWVLSQLISSCYTFTWDVKMDWGLLDKNAGENKFLREETVYRYRVRFLLVIMFYIFLKIIKGQTTLKDNCSRQFLT